MTHAARAGGLLMVAALLAGCAAQPQRPPSSAATPAAPNQTEIDARRRAEFDRSMERWHGASVQELRAKLGAPSATLRQPDGKPVWLYERSGTISGPDGPSNFRCVVSYLLDGPDPRKARVSGHRIEGC